MVRPFTHLDDGNRADRWDEWGHLGDVPTLELPSVRRVVVAAAHPDDESLGAGGLIAHATASGIPTSVLVATLGEGSHPNSPTHPPTRLADRRRRELSEATQALGLGRADVVTLGIPDGAVGDHEDAVTAALVELVGDGRDTLLVAPYRADGHHDHEAMGRGAATAARRTGALLAEYPIWLWHAGDSGDVPLRRLVQLPLSTADLERKRAAIAAHITQVNRLSDLPGDEVLLSPGVLSHFDRTAEYFVLTPGADLRDDRLDRLHADEEDPWGAESRWYESRKRSLLMAALPRLRFERALEIGCSTGLLAESLSGRADQLVAIDSSPRAVRRARARLPSSADVRLLDVPEEWPEGQFDLVVVSEVGYFLSPRELDALVERVAGCLTPDGVVVLCHWRHPIEGWPLDAAAVHQAFASSPLPDRAATYRDRDVEVVVHVSLDHWPDHRR